MIYFLYRKLAAGEWLAMSAKSIAFGFGIVALYIAPKVYGSLLLKEEVSDTTDDTITVGIVQIDADPWEKWSNARVSQVDLHLESSADLLSHDPDLVLWPETAMPFFLLHPRFESELSRLRSFVDSSGVAVLTGTPLIQYYEGKEAAPRGSRKLQEADVYYETFNGAALIQPSSDEVQTYGKMLLVPFAERVPYSEYLTFLNLLEWDVGIGGWSRGRDSTVFVLKRTKPGKAGKPARFATLICYESIYPGYTAGYVRKGAELLVIITIDSWWGKTSGPYQHVEIAKLRAVENRRWIARSASGGISSFIDPPVVGPGRHVQATLVEGIGLGSKETFYTRHGDLFAKGCTVFTAVGLLVTAVVGLRTRFRGEVVHERK